MSNIDNINLYSLEDHPIVAYVDYVLSYSCDETDWFRLKVQIVNVSPPKIKKFLSRRHFSTKKQIISSFDTMVISYIEKRLGTRLFIDKEKLHDPNWIQKPKGWGLTERNKLAKEHAKQKQK